MPFQVYVITWSVKDFGIFFKLTFLKRLHNLFIYFMICNKCKHYYITWDKNFPYGCRAMNFKSRQSPAAVVFKNSAISCQLFEKKKKPPPKMINSA